MKRCLMCSKELTGKHTKYCSGACTRDFYRAQKEQLHPKEERPQKKKNLCIYCGRTITNGNKLFCSKYCQKMYAREHEGEQPFKKYANEKERPYTKDTPMLVHNYRSRGDSWEQIARDLRRSVKNVKRAFELYEAQIGGAQ